MNTVRHMFRKRHSKSYSSGFTIIEMVVSLAIFAFMTAFLLAKYGTFNQSVLLTDLAYDTAITIRNAQASALNVQGVASSTNPSSLIFTNAYGVHFGGSIPVNQFLYFVNSSPNGSNPIMVYGAGTTVLTLYTMKAGDTISGICTQSENPCLAAHMATSLDVAFLRPNPDAIITAYSAANGTTTPAYAQVTIQANDGSTRIVAVRSTGEISVSN